MTTATTREMELVLPMVPGIEIAAARAAANFARELGMAAEHVDEMAHAIIEACINSAEHSACADQRIFLRCLGSVNADGGPRIDVWITDHGCGFDLEEARTRRQKLGPSYRRGRGLQLMEAHMDEVEISSGREGTTIHMVKYERRS